MTCRKHVDTVDAVKVRSHHLKAIYKGQCPTCGRDIYRISNLADEGGKEGQDGE
jgi:hypothetical protein